MKALLTTLLFSLVLASCGLETGKVKITSDSDSRNNGCGRVCNVQVTRTNPLTVTFQSNNLANNSFTAALCQNDGSGCALGAQVVCDNLGSCRSEGTTFATSARTVSAGMVEITFGLTSLGNASIQIQ